MITRKDKLLVVLVIGLLLTIGCSNEEITGGDVRWCEVEAFFEETVTRVGLSTMENSRNLVAKWQEDDQMNVILNANDQYYEVGPVPVREISEDGRSCKFSYRLPDNFKEPSGGYQLMCFTSNCQPKIIDNEVYYNGSLIREPLSQFKVSVISDEHVSDGVFQSNFRHYRTYELLHIFNESGKDIDFAVCGFSADVIWYRTLCAVRNWDGKAVYPSEAAQPAVDISPTVRIPANGSDIIVSSYIPNGQLINNATLTTIINGEYVNTSNTLTSSVQLQRGHAYHMYATWDGTELKFGDQEQAVGEIDVYPTELDFGAVTIGTSVTKTVNVKNVGKGPLTFYLAGGGGSFTYTPDDEVTLASGQACEVLVTFAPTSSSQSGVVLRVFSDASNGTKYIKCNGAGIESGGEIKQETITVNGVSFKMVTVEGGTFMMGSPDDDPDAGGIYSDEKPQHQVTLSTFAIGETEVTQELWKAVMGNNPSIHKGNNLPVEEISWENAQSFINKLNSLTGRSFRLPTEAEWEYAARGGKHSKGFKYAGSNDVYEVSWNIENSEGVTHPVATKKPNELGLYDMSGNVWEWCQDWYDFDYYKNSPSLNPCNTVESAYRIHRGASIEYIVKDHRVAMRGDYINSASNRMRGLRLVLTDDSSACIPEAVDLGLSVKWASYNLGATKPEEYGGIFAWGETSSKSYYSKDTYKWYEGLSTNTLYLTKYNYDSSYGTVDNKMVLDLEDDVAHVKLGGNWRMPTDAEWTELRTKCTWTWTTKNGVAGVAVTGPNRNSIFLPAAGAQDYTGLYGVGSLGSYWSSSLNTVYPFSAWYVWFDSEEVIENYDFRYHGRSVRPVSE